MKNFLEFTDDDNYLIRDVNNELVDNYKHHLMNGDIKAVTVNTYLRNVYQFEQLIRDVSFECYKKNSKN